MALWDVPSRSRVQLDSESGLYLRFASWSSNFEDTFMWSSVLSYAPHCFGGQSSSAMFSCDSRYLLIQGALRLESPGEHPTCLWDVATVKLIRKFVGHSDSVISVAFSLDGRFIATSSLDHTVII
ncbi:uncharacterized protein PHACADRAFT_192353 [Phanerochaete carnosa HHB-10118-sp]|uniref:Uncharacterized protein n=1 Tax=Phanerochaete carnosa (strain HHB-10118-sp) TaxID=650164 RepID=K5WLA7_PHACS|nr:uncharacterized protein PHACADRAFT_192353 [Phanerochaete carnosa HHB-10118-sp]EKM59959.1 hypothetical protein PHACADRAFT_192353 [Phanerochaete carnosa HHB-10118-sp]